MNQTKCSQSMNDSLNNNKDLIVFSNSYPIKKGEPFLANEINILSKLFDKIKVYCGAEDSQEWYWSAPPNVEIVLLSNKKKRTFSKKLWLSLMLKEVFEGKAKIWELKHLGSFLADKLRLVEHLADQIKDSNLKDDIFYSYWFDDWALVLSVLKQRHDINKFITRAHRFDLFENLRENKRIPFRAFQLSQVSKVYSVSKAGTDYLSDLYPQHSELFDTSYLGTIDHGAGAYSPSSFTIVSCSRLVSVKRVDLILEAIKDMTDVTWVHCGDGPLLKMLQIAVEKVQRDNKSLCIDLKGHVRNEELMKFYAENSVNAFINVSTSEGLPVSIMEAASFGIPLIATDVGGTNEIVNEDTGVLLKKDPSVDEIRQAIQYIKLNFSEEGKRSRVREYWLDNFHADKNYVKFANEIKNIFK